MSRVHCSACGTAVVVDPSGLCPGGHHVGSAGARVAQAMGSGTPHADEPQPWVAQVVLDDDPTPTAAAPRRARPVSAPGIEVADDDQESLLRELHALAEFDLDGFGGDSSTAPSPPTPAYSTAHSATPTPAPAPTPTQPAMQPTQPAMQPTQPAMQRPASLVPRRGDELAALEAALHELSLPDESTPAPAPTDGSERTGNDSPELLDGLAGLAELGELFATPASSPPPASVTPSEPKPAAADPARAPQEARAADHDIGSTPPDPRPTGHDTRPPDPRPTGHDTGSAQEPSLAPPPAAPAPPTQEEDTPAPAAAPANLDITNFTAKGGKVGGRKRLFGR